MRTALPRRRTRADALRARLELLAATFGPEHLSPDPLEVVREYDDPRDLEVVGLLGAGLAFGSARGAVRSLRDLLSRLGGPPAAAVLDWDPPRDRPRLEGWRHRWLGPDEASAVLAILGRALREHGSLEAFFVVGDDSPPGTDGGRACGDRRLAGIDGRPASVDNTPASNDPIGRALASFAHRALALAPPGAPARTAYWFAGPASGGASKRLCLFLRWMCRRDGLDPGPWTSIDPARLVIPLDTHVARIARYVGLLHRQTADWKAALELTAALRAFDPADPVRFDYAICRLGILDLCPRRRDRRKCAECPLFDVCLL